MKQGKGAALLQQVKSKQQAQSKSFDKVVKKKPKKTAFDKVNFNG